jgi:lysophospholipase L1-like esterase
MKKLKLLTLLLTITLISTSFKPKEITWTAIGDSITYLNDHLDETGNRLTKGYLTDVVAQLPNIHYLNQGHNGWPATGIAEKIDSLGIQKSDVYTIFLGTNDWWYGKPLGTMKDYINNTGYRTTSGAFRIIINKIRSLNPDAKIIMMTPLQRSDFVYVGDSHNNAWGSYKAKNGQLLSQFADAVDSIAAYEHIPVVDLYYKSGITVQNMVKFKYLKDPKSGEYKNYKYPDYEGIPFNPDSDKYPYPIAAIDNAYDGLHPSDKGCRVIAGMLVGVLKGMK